MANSDISEENWQNYLISTGIKKSDIKRPDKEKSIIGTADFLVDDVVFEVKEIKPNKKRKSEIEDKIEKLSKGEVVSGFLDDRQTAFSSHLEDARKKFRKYKGYSTAVVFDVRGYLSIDDINISQLLFGSQVIHIDRKSKKVSRSSWKNREVRVDKNHEIGCFVFVKASKILMYHNLLAEEHRLLPIEYINKFNRAGTYQYMFVNPPKFNSIVKELL